MSEKSDNRLVKIISGALMGGGALLLIVSFIPGIGINLALPLVFLMLGAALILLEATLTPAVRWAALLFLPSGLLLAFGFIFLLNTITGDWNAWAYAWLLLLAGAGFGVILAARRMGWRQEVLLAGGGAVVLGVTLFALFGAIAGGLFIQVMAPVLLVLGGLALRWTGFGRVLTDRLHRRPESAHYGAPPQPAPPALAELLSEREIEVLGLISDGLTNAQIAARLTVAQSTVKTHINNIYGKLGAQTRVQAVNRARELGLLNRPPES